MVVEQRVHVDRDQKSQSAWQRSLTISLNSGVLATKSVSQLTSTRAPVSHLFADVRADAAFGGDAALLLGGLRQALFAQDSRSPFRCRHRQAASAFLQSIMPAAGTAAQIHNHLCADFSHGRVLLNKNRFRRDSRDARLGVSQLILTSHETIDAIAYSFAASATGAAASSASARPACLRERRRPCLPAISLTARMASSLPGMT